MKTEYTMFRLSKPVGYNPPDVEACVKRYEDTIGRLNSVVDELTRKNLDLQQRVERLQDELRNMHVEMSLIELPDSEQAVEAAVLQEFKVYHAGIDSFLSMESKKHEESTVNQGEDDDGFEIVS